MWKLVTIILVSGLLLGGCNYRGWPFGVQISPTPTSTPGAVVSGEEVMGVKEQLETRTARTLPSDAEQIVLRDVSGGSGSGIATRKFANNRFEHTILADLPNPDSGKFYEGWLVRGAPDQPGFESISTGKLQQSKGGWVLEYSSGENRPDHRGVVVTLETVSDQRPETHILEGSF